MGGDPLLSMQIYFAPWSKMSAINFCNSIKKCMAMSRCVPYIWECDDVVPCLLKQFEISGKPLRAWNMECCAKWKLVEIFF